MNVLFLYCKLLQYTAIASRPGTKLIEFHCFSHADQSLDPSLKTRNHNTNTSYIDWYGASTVPWFGTWTRRLGIEHFEKESNYGKNITLNLTEELPFIANRFGLVPKLQQQDAAVKNSSALAQQK
jgi:hypothetical protein